MPTVIPIDLALDVTALIFVSKMSLKVFTLLTVAAATFSFSAVSMLRKPHMMKPFCPIIKSKGGDCGKSIFKPVAIFPLIFRCFMFII